MTKIAPHRILILDALLEIEQGKHAEDCLAEVSAEDRALVQHLLFGILRWRGSLDLHIRQFVHKNPKKSIRNILRMAIFEHFFSRTPKHALLHQAVELCRHIGRKNDAKFVNAILRKAINLNKEELNLDPYNDLPEWLAKRWKKETDWVESLRNQPTLALYYQTLEHKNNSQRVEKDVFISGNQLSNMSYPEMKGNISALEGYQEGHWWIMNPAAAYPIALLSKILDLKDKTVLDMCAAPGGKSFCFVSKGAEVVATDISEKRLAVMKENISRLGFAEKMTIAQHDWQQEYQNMGRFDVVILDAPCSGTGVIRKHPEIKWKRTEQDVLAATVLQKRLLKIAQKYVKNGGYLIYCVCSVLWEEGAGMIRNLDEEKWKLHSSWNSLEEKDSKLDGFQVFILENLGEE